ncbi:MAG: phosphoribosylamine--glycine ligase [Myxococcota bacterium]
MRVVLVGSGGRENALGWLVARHGHALIVTADNPGWPSGTVVRAAPGVGDVVELCRAVRPDLVIVGPEAPLAEGLADALAAAGIPCFGPTREAARLETSKAFAKEVMAAAEVPTARSIVAAPTDPAAIERCDQGMVVVKADGLAGGKGVYVCKSANDARNALLEVAKFGEAAATVVLEDLLVGPEVSVFGLSDGERVVPLITAQDHKQLHDGGRGPNTGGMGAYAPCPLANPAAICRLVHEPVIRELARRGTPFRGVLFAGIMVTQAGPMVLEFNVRFGDPELQAIAALWEDDPVPWLLGAATGQLPSGTPRFASGSACCVVLASRGYPASAEVGTPIPEAPESDGVLVFHAGTTRGQDGVLRTNGGRVLGITGIAGDLSSARARAYGAVDGWRFAGAQLRTDIGKAPRG